MPAYTKEYAQIFAALRDERLNDVYARLAVWAAALQNGQMTDTLTELRQNYGYLLSYFVENKQDPQRRAVLEQLLADTQTLADNMLNALLERESPLFQFVAGRTYRYTTHPQPQQILHILRDYADGIVPRLNYANCLNELFDMLWLQTEYDEPTTQLYTELLSDAQVGMPERSLAVSALTLNLWRHFSESKMHLLLDTCQRPADEPQRRAWVGLCFLAAKYNERIASCKRLVARITEWTASNFPQKDLGIIALQIARTAQTEEVSRKLKDEILPEMLRASARLKDGFDLKNDDGEAPNPAWKQLADDDKLNQKLQEMSEMQQNGSDVYMTAFARLKNFPFFALTSHWFMPFDERTEAIAPLFSGPAKAIFSKMVDSGALCNSDKYSFCLAALQMPDSQRNAMQISLGGELEQMEDQNTPDMAAESAKLKQQTNQYVQDLYRFFKLHRAHADFDDPFAYATQLHRTDLFSQCFAPADLLPLADLYVSMKHYAEALELLEEQPQESAEVYQKIGYCHQRQKQYQAAILAYERADLLSPDDLWTLRQLALCARAQGNWSLALDDYRRIEARQPDDKRNRLSIGLCLLEMQQYAEALNVYFKLDIDFPDDVQVWRALGWCSFLAGKSEQANRYWQRVLATSKPTAADWLNAAHNLWCAGSRKEAIDMYRRSRAACANTAEFARLFEADVPYLCLMGVSSDDARLLSEAVSAD